MRAAGIRELREYRQGKKLGAAPAIRAACADCMCGYVDGRLDCERPECPLYPWMPYSQAVKRKRSEARLRACLKKAPTSSPRGLRGRPGEGGKPREG